MGAAPERFGGLMLRHSVQITADHGLSSAVNFLAGLIAARYTGPSGFGLFTLAYAAVVLATSISRAMNGEAGLALTASRRTNETTRLQSGQAHVAVCLAVLLSLPVALYCWTTTRSLPLTIIGMLVVPVVSLCDAYRYTAFQRSQPGIALEMDAFWLVLTGVAAGVAGAWHPSPEAFLGAWGVGAGAAAALGAMRLKVDHPLRHRSAGAEWLTRSRRLGPWLALQVVTAAGMGLFLITIVEAHLDASSVGMLRAAQMLVTPIVIVLSAISTIVLRRFADEATGREIRIGALLLWTVPITGAASMVCLVFLAAGEWMVTTMFGQSFSGADRAIAAFAGVVFSQALALIPGAALRLLEEGTAVVGSQITGAIIGAGGLVWFVSDPSLERASLVLLLQSAGVCSASWLFLGQVGLWKKSPRAARP